MKVASIISRILGSTMFSAIAGVVGLIALLVMSLINDFQDANQHAQVEAENVSRLLDEHALAIVQKVDLVLRDVQRDVRPDDMRLKRGASGARAGELHALLKAHVDAVPEVSLLHLIASDGEHIHSSLASLPSVNLADRPYFRRQKDDAAAGLVISPPLVSRVTNNWTLILSRRINFEDGGFAGTVQASLDMRYFQQFYHSLDLGKGGLVALYDTELRLASRYPPSERDMGNASNLNAKFYLDQGMQYATYRGKSPVDGIQRLYSFRQVGDLPLIVIAGIAEDDFLAESYRHVWQYGIGAMIFVFVAMGFGMRQRRSEEALRESVAFQNSLLNAIPIPVFYKDRDGRYLGFNRAYETFFGAKKDHLIGKTAFDISPRELAEIYHAKDTELIASGGIQQYESQVRNARGELRDVIFNKAVFADRRGSVGGLLGAILDITDRKQAESMVLQLNADLEQRVARRTAQLEAANKELEEFSYSMSHDMRTPLRALDGFSKILLEEHCAGIDDEGKRLLGVLRNNARRMGRLIDDMLRFWSLGRRRMDYNSVDIADLASAIFTELQAATPLRPMRLEIGALPLAWGDRGLLGQAVRELLSNAVKYSRADGEALIVLSGGVEEQEDVYSVTDRGVGFDMRYADKLFRVFERVHQTGQYEGSGIGLAIVKRVIERHSGRVWAEGTVGEGATFHFALPHRKSD